MSMTTTQNWIPSSMEQTCLKHLDSPGSWSRLKSPEPEQTDPMPWVAIRRIFNFNITLFGIAFALLFALLAGASGYSRSDFQEDLLPGVGIIVLLSGLMAGFAANLYRRAWNRRAKYLRQQDAAE